MCSVSFHFCPLSIVSCCTCLPVLGLLSSGHLHAYSLVLSHPVYQYWTRAYDLSGQALHWEPAQKLGTLEIGEIAAIQSEKSAVKYFIWEGPPTEENITKIKMTGLINIVVNPCGARPAKGDFLSVMRENISSLSEAVGQGSSTNTVSP